MHVLLDEDGSIARTYRVSGIPISFFIDREGVIRTRHLGPLSEMLILQYVQLMP